MKNAPVKKILIFGIFIFILISGCANIEQTPTDSGLSNPAATQTITATHAPEILTSPTAPIPETTPTAVNQSAQTSLVSKTDQAVLVSETYPDNSTLKPEEKFIKTFELKNVGASVWTTAYSLTLDSTPQNEIFNSPAQIQFPKETPPGESLRIELALVAPATVGTYAVYWTLRNERGEIISVGGGKNIWAKIVVCAPNQPCNTPVSGGNASAGGVSATLTDFSSEAQSAVASFCMTLPNRNYAPAPGTVSLILDQQTISASTGGSLSQNCFSFNFPATASQVQAAGSVAVSIAQVRILGGPNYPDETCQAVRPTLVAQYPGLDFKCNFSMAGYYTDLQTPAGMTAERAQQIIFDAIEGAINGPWLLTVR